MKCVCMCMCVKDGCVQGLWGGLDEELERDEASDRERLESTWVFVFLHFDTCNEE